MKRNWQNGGIFRKMYGMFLIEADNIIKDGRLKSMGERFIEVSELWDDLANDLWLLSTSGKVALLEKMSDDISKIYDFEKALYLSLLDIAA